MVWTVHNFYAHDYPHPLIDRLGTFLVRTLADEIIVQQEKTLSDWKTRYPSKSITHIPHGNYIGAYGPMVNRDHKLRMSLGFSESDIVLISFGAIAPYKCNEKIIKAFHTAKKKQPLLKLLIMGKGNSKYVESLISSVAGEQGIIIRNTFIPDEEMPKYLSIADYSIFYYDDSEMTSGGLILSLSYGIPVIIRNIPASEAVNRANGHVFGSDQELVEILQNLKKPLNPTLVRDTIETVLQYGWDDIADKLIGLYSRE
jgi:glycosyltransferase involved in cell wall biosynthesis